MRPTREGRITPQRAGLVYSGIGIDPDVITTDPVPPTDRAELGEAYVPFLVTGAAALVQSDSSLAVGFVAVSVTLPNPPTVGNVLVVAVAYETDNGPTYSLNNGTWTQVTPDVYSGNGTNLPNRMFYQVVTSSTSATTTITPSGGTGIGGGKAVVVELSGVDTLDADHASASNTATTSDSITPSAGLPAVLLSSTFSRGGAPPIMAPAGSMTELYEIGTSRPLAFNYQLVTSTTGSYTVGSTGAGVNASMIGGAFLDTGESIVWIPAPLTVDDDDATYDYAYATGIEEFWRADLGDTYLIGSVEVVLGFETAGSNAVLLQGANEADYSDAVTIVTIPYTATGSLTADTINDSWDPTAVYRYWQLVQTTEDNANVYEVHLYDAGETTEGVTDHEDLTGRDAADQHPADSIEVADSAGWYEADEVEGALAELAAKVVGYQAHGNTGTTETFDAAIGWHSATLNNNCTFTLTANPTGTVSSLFLELLQDGTGGRDITLPGSVVNAAELEADQVTTLDTTSLLVLLTRDGGTTWYGGWWGGSGGSTIDPATTVESETSFFISPAVGTDVEYARQDHTHGSPGDAQLQAAGHWEVMMDGGSPPAALENGSGTDWLYVWVPA